VYLNLSPGVLSCTDVLRVVAGALPIEKAEVMDYARTGPYALPQDPPIWNEFATILRE
jgi:L-fucose mutarotase